MNRSDWKTKKAKPAEGIGHNKGTGARQRLGGRKRAPALTWTTPLGVDAPMGKERICDSTGHQPQ